jgi:hypothetical protein
MQPTLFASASSTVWDAAAGGDVEAAIVTAEDAEDTQRKSKKMIAIRALSSEAANQAQRFCLSSAYPLRPLCSKSALSTFAKK